MIHREGARSSIIDESMMRNSYETSAAPMLARLASGPTVGAPPVRSREDGHFHYDRRGPVTAGQAPAGAAAELLPPPQRLLVPAIRGSALPIRTKASGRRALCTDANDDLHLLIPGGHPFHHHGHVSKACESPTRRWLRERVLRLLRPARTCRSVEPPVARTFTICSQPAGRHEHACRAARADRACGDPRARVERCRRRGSTRVLSLHGRGRGRGAHSGAPLRPCLPCQMHWCVAERRHTHTPLCTLRITNTPQHIASHVGAPSW